MSLLHPLLLYNNFLLLLLLLGRLFGLDLSLLLPKDPFNLCSKAKSFQSLVFISNSLGQFLLPLLLNVILVHQRNKYVPLDVNLHQLQVDNTEVLLSSDEAALVDNGLLGLIIIPLKTRKTWYSKRTLLMTVAQQMSSTPPKVFIFLKMLTQIVCKVFCKNVQ